MNEPFRSISSSAYLNGVAVFAFGAVCAPVVDVLLLRAVVEVGL